MSRRYLASLAVAAVVVLAVGILVRDRLLRAQASAPAPPSEASVLQQLSQEGQVRRLSDYLSERVAAVAPNVVYVADVNAAGVLLGHVDSLVTTAPGHPVFAARVPAVDSLRIPSVGDADPEQREWALVVGRTADGTIVSTAGILGGRAAGRCGQALATEYVLNVSLHDSFAGAGVFDLGGRLIGTVVRCNGRNAAIPISEVRRLLTASAATEARIWDAHGIAVTPLDDSARAFFGSDSGLLVTAVRLGSPAHRASLRPGDVLLTVDTRSIASVDDLRVLVDASRDDHTVTRKRGRSVSDIGVALAAPQTEGSSTHASTSDAGIVFEAPRSPVGLSIATVRPGSFAAAAGLRAGDRLLLVDGQVATSLSQTRRMLNGVRRTSPSFIVFERDSVQRGVLIPR
jgi:serine protease Do